MKRTAVYGAEHVPVWTPEESALIDHDAHASGIASSVLMESAGRATAGIVQHLYPDGLVVGVAGSGHNGGDAVVALRTLKAWGRDVCLVHAGTSTSAGALTHGWDLPVVAADDARATFARAAVLLDGILGTGARGEPREPAARLIARMNESGVPICALDLPSGVDALTGAVHISCVRAALTVSFGAPKIGLLLHPAREQCGRLVAVEIGFPPRPARAMLITPWWAHRRLPRRAPDAHKAAAGRLLVVAGRRGMAGAAVIAARAAVRAGAGLVYVASAGDNRTIVQRVVPEAIFLDVGDDNATDGALRAVDAVVAGPGMGTDAASRALLRRVLDAGTPAVLDADALTLLAQHAELLDAATARADIVLTPHPGEMGRLMQSSTQEIVKDRVQSADDFVRSRRCALLLKGAPSIVAAAGAPLMITSVGSSDLATAGMGDQLAGTIGALLAAGTHAGISVRDAACLGLFYSGRAADLLSLGRSLSPMDVSRALPRAFRSPGARTSPLGAFVTFDQPARH